MGVADDELDYEEVCKKEKIYFIMYVSFTYVFYVYAMYMRAYVFNNIILYFMYIFTSRCCIHMHLYKYVYLYTYNVI